MARSSFELGLRLTCEQVRIAQNNKDRLDSARSACLGRLSESADLMIG